MDESAHCGGALSSTLEQTDLVDHTRGPQLLDPEAGLDIFRKSQLSKEPAARLGDDPVGLESASVGARRVDQESIDRGIEEQVIGNVVDVPVDVLSSQPVLMLRRTG
jgi:hypothetical protein